MSNSEVIAPRRRTAASRSRSVAIQARSSLTSILPPVLDTVRFFPLLAVAGFSLMATAVVRGQNLDSLRRLAIDGAPSAGSLHHAILPRIVGAAYRTRSWVRDSLPVEGVNDLTKIDLIFLHALAETEGDRRDAILATAVSVLATRTIPTTFGIDFPLALESDIEFNNRIRRLPDRLYADQPDGGDLDKLQHFFFSAWLSWDLDNRGFADILGNGVETGEDLFIRGGSSDARDVRTNRLGALFARLLGEFPDLLPGRLFAAWNRCATRVR